MCLKNTSYDVFLFISMAISHVEHIKILPGILEIRKIGLKFHKFLAEQLAIILLAVFVVFHTRE